jgi:hypothetical protein
METLGGSLVLDGAVVIYLAKEIVTNISYSRLLVLPLHHIRHEMVLRQAESIKPPMELTLISMIYYNKINVKK